jgi:hypothetical protein
VRGRRSLRRSWTYSDLRNPPGGSCAPASARRSFRAESKIDHVSRPGTRKYERKEDVEWEVLLARVLQLPEAEQLKIQHGLTEALGGRLGKETARAKQTRLRYEAVEALRVAAQHLRLPPGQAPTIPEFRKALSETKLPMTFNAVYEAFEKNWETATRIYRGEKMPVTAAQRSARRAILGRNRTDKEPPIAGLRFFLTQDPPPHSTGLADYEDWATEVNEHPPPGMRRVIGSAHHIRKMSRASWGRCLAVARNEMTLEEAQKQTVDEQLSESGPLVGLHLASWILGTSADKRVTSRPGYPEPVVCLGKSNWLWLLSDIRAYGAGKRDFRHSRGHLQRTYMDSTELAEWFEINYASLQQRINADGEARGIVPPRMGRAGKRLYWERAQVERWLQQHPSVIGRKGTGPLGRPAPKAVLEISESAPTAN